LFFFTLSLAGAFLPCGFTVTNKEFALVKKREAMRNGQNAQKERQSMQKSTYQCCGAGTGVTATFCRSLSKSFLARLRVCKFLEMLQKT
jgi:hypothetical protein